MHISELSYKYKTIFWAIMFVIVVSGVWSYMRISKLEDPELTVMQAVIVTIYPGASAEEVEHRVSDVLEDEIRTMSGISEVVSTSIANVSQINVLLDFSVPDDEITQYWDILRRKVGAAQAKLPEGCMETQVIDDFGDVYGMFYAMRGDGFTPDEMKLYSEKIKKELLLVDGVKRVGLFGNMESVINIDLAPERLAELGVYPAQIVLAVKQHIATVYAGNYHQNNYNVRLVVDDDVVDIEDIRDIVIRGYEGDNFKLGDIANIEWERPKTGRFSMMYNGDVAVGVSVCTEKDVNVIDVGESVEKKLDEIMGSLPVGITLDKVFFQPQLVRNSINSFMMNLLMSVAVVIIVLMFTMGIRGGVIIGAGLILTILASFPILYMLDGDLQRISLGAFVVAMGMLVDNAIVVMDGINVDLQYGRGIKYSLFATAKKTGYALMGATLIAVIAFLPVYLSPDTAGVYVGDLFIVLCISLMISWLLALTQIPIFAGRMLKFKAIAKSGGDGDPFDGKFFCVFKKVLTNMMEHRYVTMGMVVMLLSISMFGFIYVKRTFFPDFNYNQAVVEFTMPNDVSIENMICQMEKISDDLVAMEGINAVTSSHGMTPTRYCLVRPFNQGRDNYAEFIIEFEDFEEMLRLRESVENYFYDNYPDGYSRFRQYNLSIVSSHTVEVEFTGEDLNVLRDLTEQAKGVMYGCELVNGRTVQSDLNGEGKVLGAGYRSNIGSIIGISRMDVSNTLLAATDGLPIAKLWDDDYGHKINLRLRNKDGSTIHDLTNLPVWSLIPDIRDIDDKKIGELVTGSTTVGELQKDIVSSVPLMSVAPDFKLKSEENMIRRVNGFRAIQAQCEPHRWSSPADVRKAILEDIENIELPEGYSMRWVGEHDLQKKALTNIINLLPVAALMILFILIFLFNSVKKTLIVVLCLPMAAIGIVPGLLIFDQPFSFVAIVGTIGMAGMLIKNSIVLIEEIDTQIANGVDDFKAIVVATTSRVKPVMMASVTTILGMIPLIFDPMYGALAVTVMCGLSIGTIITLFVLPIIYMLLFRITSDK